METIGSQKRQSLKESGHKFVGHNREGFAILEDIETKERELWVAHDDHAGYVIEIDNIGYEFVANLTIR